MKGPQVFYYRDSVKGEELAEIIQEKLNDYLEVERPRQAKGNTTYYLLKRSPGILNIVECGFLTNPEEAGKLLQDDYQEKVAAAVADGVEEYIKIMNNENPLLMKKHFSLSKTIHFSEAVDSAILDWKK